MALQTINLGTVINDGTGDDLRTAFEKVVYNFNDINGRLSDTTTAENVGPEGEGIFKDKTNGTNLRFKKIVGGDNILLRLTDDGDTITVDFNVEDGIDFDSNDLSNLGNVTVLGNIQLNGTTSKLIGDVQGHLLGDVVGTVYAPVGTFGLQGNVVGRNPTVGPEDPLYDPALVDGVSVLDLDRNVNNYDFGTIGNVVEVVNPSTPGIYFGTGLYTTKRVYQNKLEYILDQIGTDLGTILAPSPYKIDMGAF